MRLLTAGLLIWHVSGRISLQNQVLTILQGDSKLVHFYTYKFKHLDGIRLSVAVPVNHFFYITQVN